jgi:hypothetical protein
MINWLAPTGRTILINAGFEGKRSPRPKPVIDAIPRRVLQKRIRGAMIRTSLDLTHERSVKVLHEVIGCGDLGSIDPGGGQGL